MGSHMNFKNFGDVPVGDSSGGKQTGNVTLARQPSIYSLTFDELQNTLGSMGKDFGSMNMDELLKNIWTAEETQIVTSAAGTGGGGTNHGGNLQRQGSLTLPRTLSQKTVDEVWRDLLKESGGGGSGGGGGGGGGGTNRYGGGGATNLSGQQTLGEMTLEEFLARAGVVREDAQAAQLMGRQANSGFYNEFYRSNDASGLALGYQQPGSQNNGLMDNQVTQKNNSAPNQPPSLALNMCGIRSSQQHMQQQQQPILPKPTTIAFAPASHLVSNGHQLPNRGTRTVVGGIAEPAVNTTLVQTGGIGMAALGTGGVTVAAGSPANHMSSDVITKSSVDTSSLSPAPYVFSRGRKSGGALEKVVERRQRRMIKNRESAARSRARKQAYTLELEAEVAKLKETNKELQQKQAECMEMQKNQILETMNRQNGSKRHCLRRTLTGPW